MFRFLILLSFLLFGVIKAQPPRIIKVKKSGENFIFFQKGREQDTVSKNSGDLFYLLVDDKIKKGFVAQVENGMLLKTANDSIYRLNYVKGIAYECFFEKKSNEIKPDAESIKYEYKCLINGVSLTDKNKIVIRFKNKNESAPSLENTFFVRPD